MKFETKDEILTSTLREVCEAMGLAPVAVATTGNQNPKAIAARRIVVTKLYDIGFSTGDIAALLKMNRATVNYLRARE